MKPSYSLFLHVAFVFFVGASFQLAKGKQRKFTNSLQTDQLLVSSLSSAGGKRPLAQETVLLWLSLVEYQNYQLWPVTVKETDANKEATKTNKNNTNKQKQTKLSNLPSTEKCVRMLSNAISSLVL